MREIAQKFQANRVLQLIYVSSLLLSFHYYFVVYVNSSVLEQYSLGKVPVGILYTLGSILNVILFLYISRFLKRNGSYKLALVLILLELALILGMAISQSFAFIAPIFIVHHAIIPLISFDLDIFLEGLTKNGSTGKVRGLFMTISNIPVVLSPFIVGWLIVIGGIQSLYLISTIFLIPLFFIILGNLKSFKDANYTELNLVATTKLFYANKNIYNIFMANFLLQIFYAWMVIYMPIYLRDVIGFSWSQIGIMFTIMLLPFLLFELPLGIIADKKYGEQEILVTGFFILAIATGALAFVTGDNIYVWSALLFATRVGASFIEITSESYFFKQIGSGDASLISFFRINRALAYVFAPLLATLSLLFLTTYLGVDFRYSFLILGVIMFSGLRYAVAIEDTK